MKPWQFLALGVGFVASILGIAGYSLRDIFTTPNIIEFSIDPSGLFPGERATIRWNVANAANVLIEPDIGSVPSTGTHSIVVSGGHRTYTLTARNRAGASTQTLPVSPMELPVPSVQIFATPATQLKGEKVTLNWVANDADKVVIAGIGEVLATGSRQETAIESRTFEITASNRFKRSATARVAVTVQEWPMPTISLRASPNPVIKGRQTLVHWETSFAKQVIVEPLGNVAASGEATLTVESSFTVKALVEGPGGSQTAELSIEAIPAVQVVLPRNQELRIRLARPLGSSISHVEEEFEAALARDLRIRGTTIAVSGARVWGRVASLNSPGRVRGKASIGLILERLVLVDGSTVELETGIERRERSSLSNDLLRTLITTGVGAAVGAAADGAKGAATGAAGGAAAGAGASLIDRGDEVVLPVGFEIGFRTRNPKTVEVSRPR